MRTWHYELDQMIREELDRQKKIAIYTMGRVGLHARDILNNRYGRKGIYIDNRMAEYNKEIITFDQFMQEYDSGEVSIILCAGDEKLNLEITKSLEDRKVRSTIRSLWNKPVIISEPQKELYFREIKELCLVEQVKNIPLIRLGTKNDGGYILLDDFENVRVVYGFGIGANADFEKSFADAGIQTYCYDPTIKALPVGHPRLRWKKTGISGEDNRELHMLSMKSILQNNNHMDEKNMILKMDVEGAEWDAINATDSEIMNQFKQMTFEFHDLTDESKKTKIIPALEKINRTHQAVWVHANSAGGASVGQETLIPRLLEITYVKRENYCFQNTDYNAPISLDDPNVIGIFDLALMHWGKIWKK